MLFLSFLSIRTFKITFLWHIDVEMEYQVENGVFKLEFHIFRRDSMVADIRSHIVFYFVFG